MDWKEQFDKKDFYDRIAREYTHHNNRILILKKIKHFISIEIIEKLIKDAGYHSAENGLSGEYLESQLRDKWL